MRWILCLVCLASLVLPASADDAQVAKAKTKAFLELETARRERAHAKKATYDQARDVSVKTGAPLVVVVGASRADLEVSGWLIVSQPAGFGGIKSGIVVSKDGYWLDTLPATASAREIEQALTRPIPIKTPPSTPTSFLTPVWHSRAAPMSVSC